MGATGSYFERWMSSDTIMQEKYSELEQKIMLLEKNHTVFVNKIDDTVSDLVSRIDTVEKKASTMVFQQQEPDFDLVIIP
jgi:hypothetical protein